MSWPIWSGRKIVTITSGAPTTRNSRKKSCCHGTKLRESLTGERHPLQSEARDQNPVGQGPPALGFRLKITDVTTYDVGVRVKTRVKISVKIGVEISVKISVEIGVEISAKISVKTCEQLCEN